jgi:hypothetical protein
MARNAIERRIDHLASLWNSASDEPAIRLVRWLVDLDEGRMVDVFVALEGQSAAQTADAFLKLGTPFENERDYATALLRELMAAAEASREGLRAKGLRDDWRAPAATQGQGAGRHLLIAAASLAAHYEDRFERLVLVLAPAAIRDSAGWRRWIEQLLRADIPASLRVMLCDPADAPLLDGIEAGAPGRAITLEPRLNMVAAISELARAEGADGPAKSFRIQLVALAAAARVKNGEAAQQAADRAVAIAHAEKWPDQEVVAMMALGATRLATGELDLAVRAYRGAFRAAEQAGVVGHPAAPKLRVAAGMGLGGAMLAAACWADAARVYEATAPLALTAQDGIMTVEAWRMASYCHAQAGAAAHSWQCGAEALQAGAALPPDLRGASTLPWVAQTMLRLIKGHVQQEQHTASLRARMDALLGQGWEARLDPAPAAP